MSQYSVVNPRANKMKPVVVLVFTCGFGVFEYVLVFVLKGCPKCSGRREPPKVTISQTSRSKKNDKELKLVL